jgi:hypothetical protein
MKLLDTYVHTAPSPENVLDIFKGEWISKLPGSSEGLELFNDGRIEWAEQILGKFQGQFILELGPLEGGHSYMLHKRNAARVVAIEANTKAFLKCLCVKEMFELHRVEFLLGDFVKFLEVPLTFDTIIASGVLYHMTDPLLLLKRISKCTDKVYLWTHYYDREIIPTNKVLRKKFRPGGFWLFLEDTRYEAHCQFYGESVKSNSFCGGSGKESMWLTYHGVLDALKQVGFTKLDINFHDPFHFNGPAFAVCAQKQ